MEKENGREEGNWSYLSSGIDNLSRIVLPLVANLLTKGVLDSRVVALDKVAVYVADGEGGFA